jgi:hypothetical protein
VEENFDPVARTRANYYTPGSPVQFVCVELLKGESSGEHAVCLTFKNISKVTLTALEIHFKCKGVDGIILCEDEFEYRDIAVKPGESFGMDDAVFVTQKAITSVDVSLKNVYNGKRVVHLDAIKRVRLPAPRRLSPELQKALEARMNRRARSRGWLWTGGLAAAAVLALVIWLLPSPEKMPLEELSPFQKEISEKAEEMNILPEHPVLPVEPVKKRIAKVLKWEKKAKLSAIVGEKEAIREDEKCETIEIIEKDAIAAIVEEPSAKEDASEDSTDIVVKRGDSTVPLPEGERSPRRKASLKKKAKKSKRNKWLLAAAVGSSGYVDSFLNTDMSYGDVSSPGDMNVPSQDPDPNKPDKDDNEKENGNTPPQTASFRNAPVLRSSKVDENFLDNRSFESYPDVSYSLPISFGFTVRKDLSRRIAVESGLMYTYLSTTFKRGGDCPSEVKSSLHYLGIPLNLVVYVWKNQRWNVYLSGGFMMEKGLQAVYSGYIAGNGTTISKSKKEGIHGMQWSVNASVGAAYRFYGDWSLYFEPRFSHYFDCDQPASIRTDKPLGFGLSAGIRYAF